MQHPTFTIRSGKAEGQVLEPNSWFRLRRHPGDVFRFLHFDVHKKGGEWVAAYGGDPNPRGRRQNRSFGVDERFIPCPTPVRLRAE